MALRIVCTCGFVIQGGSDDEPWANAQGHMDVPHPELVGNVTRADILAQAEVLGPGAVQEPPVNGAQGRQGVRAAAVRDVAFGSAGQVVGGDLYYDQLSLLTHLGLMPQPSGA